MIAVFPPHRKPFRRHLAALAALLWLAGWPAAAQERPDRDAPVAVIEIRGEPAVAGIPGLRSLLAIRVGEPLTEEHVRRTLRNLHSTGQVAQAAIYSRPAEEGPPGSVVAVVVLGSQLMVEAVRLEGDLGLPEERLRSALEPAVGEALLEDRVLRDVYALKDLYEDTGFPEAEVRFAPEIHPERQQVDVVYRVDAGPRLRIGEVRFEGDLGTFEPAKLEEQLTLRPGEPFLRRRLRSDAETLRRWLVNRDYRLAQVSRPEPQIDVEDSTVDLLFTVQAGPRFEVVVEGADYDKLRKKEVLSFLSEDGYDHALLVRSEELIRRFFQGKGHYQVEVATREERLGAGGAGGEGAEEGEEIVRLHVKVEPGPTFTLRSLTFTGNEAFEAPELLERMATTPHQLLHPGSGDLVDAELEEDLENLRSFYVLQGFWDAEVGPVDLRIEGEKLDLTVPISEGRQRRVGLLLWDGFDHLPPEVLGEGFPLAERGPYHPLLLEDALNVLRSTYQALGYDKVQISARDHWIDDRFVEISFRALEGPQTVADRIVVRGNRKTDTEVIRRLMRLTPGDPVSRARLLELERSLVRLGIFSRVDITLSGGELGVPDRDVLVRVEEGEARRVSYGLGYDSDDGPRGLIGYSHRNLAGRALTLRMDARVSELDQRYRLLLDQPYLGPWDTPLTYTLFRFREDRESFDQSSWGARVEGLRDRRHQRLGLVFDYRIVDLDNVEVPLNQIEREDQEVEITSIIPSLLYDHRDDPFDPTEGWSTSVQLQYAFPALSTDAHFLKLFVQQTAYLPLGRLGVLAGSIRAGSIEPLATRGVEVPATGSTPENPVPIAERFFAGGRTSHRAYDRDELGILGRTLVPDEEIEGRLVPVGGNGLLLANLEYRFPVRGPLGGTLFLDGGNVWPDWRDVDLSEVKFGAGLGVRYRSPIGPVRLEVGWKFEREPGESGAQVFLSVGNPF